MRRSCRCPADRFSAAACFTMLHHIPDPAGAGPCAGGVGQSACDPAACCWGRTARTRLRGVRCTRTTSSCPSIRPGWPTGSRAAGFVDVAGGEQRRPLPIPRSSSVSGSKGCGELPDVGRGRGQLSADGRGVAAVGDAELGEHGGDVVVHGPHRYDEPRRDLAVGQPLADHGQDLRLSDRQSRDVRRGRRAGPARHAGEPPAAQLSAEVIAGAVGAELVEDSQCFVGRVLVARGERLGP